MGISILDWWAGLGLYTIWRLLTTREAACMVGLSVVSVCMYVCQTITFERPDIWSSFSHMPYISTGYESSSYMKVIGSSSRSQEQNGWKSLFWQCKTSIGNNSGFYKTETHEVYVQNRVFGYGGSNAVTAIFVTWREMTTRHQMHAFAGGRPYIKKKSRSPLFCWGLLGTDYLFLPQLELPLNTIQRRLDILFLAHWWLS